MRIDYNKEYYDKYITGNGQVAYQDAKDIHMFLDNVAGLIIEKYNPKTVLDAGCAMGYLVAAFRDRGVEAYGIDISEYAISQAREDIKPYCFTGSLSEPLPKELDRQYDLIITIEVIEHLYEEDGLRAIENLCKYTNHILFSSSPSDIEDITHVNVQQPEYWAKKFAKHHFYNRPDLNNDFITTWCLSFVKEDHLERVVENYERTRRIDKVRYYKQIDELERELNLKIQYLGEMEQEKNAIDNGILEKNQQFTAKMQQLDQVIEQLNCTIEEKQLEIIKWKQLVAEKEQELEVVTTEKQSELESVLAQKESDSAKWKTLLEEHMQELEQQKEKFNIDISVHRKQLKQLKYQIELLEAEKEKLLKDEYKVHYLAAIDQRNTLQLKVAELEQVHNMLLTSRSWKFTAPMRKIGHVGRKILKSNRYTHLTCKGLKSLKQHGVKVTMEKVKGKLRRDSQYKEYAINSVLDLDPDERKKQENTYFSKQVKFSIIVPLYNTPDNFLCEMIDSCINQTYSNWELCLADGSDNEHQEVGKRVQEYMKKDNRILYKKLDKNDGISGNTNAAIEMATGNYIALFDHDDLLHPSALYEYMKVIEHKDADFLYCDELTFEGSLDKVITMHFKPDFAIDNLRANNYICHFSVFKKELLDKAGLFRKEYDGSQDHDMILRLTEQAKCIQHVSKILYYWRSHPNSVAADINSKAYAIDAGKRAVRDHIRRCGMEAEVESSKAFPTIYKINYAIKVQPLISIIIPNKDNIEQLRMCIDSIINKSTYEHIEILIIENNSIYPETFQYYEELERRGIKVIKYTDSDTFNYSAINNYGVKYAIGEYLLFLNNDIEVINPEWIEELLMYAQRTDVGAVGAKLYYPNNTVQHAGIILKLGQDRVAGHCHYGCDRENLGYMGRLYYAQNFSAVTAACMLMKREVFDTVGGFDEKLAVAFNDVDLCMKIRQAGYLIAWTPYAELYHHESVSRGHEDTEAKKERFKKEGDFFKGKWSRELEMGDPYYNVNFTLDRSDFSLKRDDV